MGYDIFRRTYDPTEERDPRLYKQGLIIKTYETEYEPKLKKIYEAMKVADGLPKADFKTVSKNLFYMEFFVDMLDKDEDFIKSTSVLGHHIAKALQGHPKGTITDPKELEDKKHIDNIIESLVRLKRGGSIKQLDDPTDILTGVASIKDPLSGKPIESNADVEGVTPFKDGNIEPTRGAPKEEKKDNEPPITPPDSPKEKSEFTKELEDNRVATEVARGKPQFDVDGKRIKEPQSSRRFVASFTGAESGGGVPIASSSSVATPTPQPQAEESFDLPLFKNTFDNIYSGLNGIKIKNPFI